MTGAGAYEVIIERNPWLADVLRGRRWHPSQVWADLPAEPVRDPRSTVHFVRLESSGSGLRLTVFRRGSRSENESRATEMEEETGAGKGGITHTAILSGRCQGI